MSEVTKAVTKTQVKSLYDNLRGQLEATKENSIFIKPSEITNPTTASSNAASVINAAITKANTNGMHFVVVPAGEYWLTETVYLKSDVILKGCGMDATTLKIADNCDIDAIRVSAPTNNSGIMDLAIDGNRIQNYSTYVNGHHGNAINVWLHYGLIERVRTNWVYKHSLLLNYDTGTGDDGLGFEPEHQNDMGNLNKVLWCDFRDSLLQGVMWGWRTMDSWMCYTNIGSHAANLYLEGGTSRFIGNHFDGDGDNGAGPEYNVYCGDGCKAMVFESNIFENTQKENIFFRQPSYSNQTMTITIANNIIRTCSKSQNEQYANIKISGYSSSVPATEIVISGNQILNPDTNANHGYAGIHLLYCTNSKVVGNAFFNVGDDEVLLDNTCENVLDDGKMSTELNSKADVANPNFTGSISMGRVENTTVGEKSTATGTLVTASGPNSHAGGYGTTASGSCSSAEGNQTFAVGDYSHSQGYGTRANGDASSVEGNGTVANGANSSVSGMYNVPDSYANWPDWAPNTYYAAGAKVHLPDEEPDDPRGEYFVCNTSHTSGTAWITYSFYWDSDNGKMNYAQIVGNGSNYLQQSNAYTLDWAGNGSYAGDVTINKGTAEEVSVSALKTEINSAEELVNQLDSALLFDKDFLYSDAWLSKTNSAVTNNWDGTYTIGTGDYGSIFWESIGDVPAGKYKIPGSTFGFVTVATTKSYTENVIIKNETGEDVEFTNPTKQHLFLCQRTTTHPSRSFTFAPFILQKAVKVQEEIDDLNNAKLIERTDNIVTAIGEETTKTGNCVTMRSVIGQIVVDTTTADGTAFVCGNNLLNVKGKGTGGSGSDTLSVIVNRWVTDRNYTMGVYVDDSADHTAVYDPYVTAVAPVIPGVTYYMSVSYTFSRYYILDDEMNIVGGASSSWNSNYSFTAPANSKYLVTSFKKDSTFAYCGIRKERGEFAEIVTATDGIPVTPNCKDIMVFAPNGESISVTAFVYNENAVEKQKELDSARFVHGGSITPLTILHISDIHGDSDTIARIIEKASAFTGIDEMICTGDMVEDTYEQITSWWPANMLTCIGNHDTASYSSGTGYNWTALSMANRDAYYIAPFESNWGITHTSGKSYYYKDYATQKIRMIVMDGMLYTDNGSDATAQTAWMENLLDDAISNDLHVLIAIHGAHGGATSVDCSFSKFGGSTMPSYSDCNTPQTVIDAVAAKISGGLKFIGYLCGHVHQDWLWDAEDDGKQLMYCIACGSNDYPQWKNTDLYHSKDSDIFNLVTIDTAHTMVKLIRGGGGDFTNRMKVRKAICFDYSTGEVLGEVL